MIFGTEISRVSDNFPRFRTLQPPTHLWPVQPLPVQLRYRADADCEEDEKAAGEHTVVFVSILGNVGSDVFIPPTHRPSSPASYKPLCQQHAAIRHQLSCQRLVADPPQISMNAANCAVNNSDISPGFGGSAICRGPRLISMDESLDDPVDDRLAGRPHTALIEEVGDYGQI